ncbi:MAG: hypothetical protein WD403_05290, partial [Pirellulales bacterium]
GLLLPEARANTASADWLPLVRLAAALYWNTSSAVASTIQTSEGFDGASVMPVGFVTPPESVQLPPSLAVPSGVLSPPALHEPSAVPAAS